MSIKYLKKTVVEDPLLDKGWIAIVDYYIKNLNFLKALNYINKAIDVDGENALYWTRYAELNKRLNFFEEAEHGYRRAIELGNYEEETWISRADILLALGEIEAIVSNLNHGLEFYPNQVDMEYRLAGAYYKLNERVRARFHLQNALKTNARLSTIIDDLYPNLLLDQEVLSLIKKHL